MVHLTSLLTIAAWTKLDCDWIRRINKLWDHFREEPTFWFVPLAGETKPDEAGGTKPSCIVVCVVNGRERLVLHGKTCEGNCIKDYRPWSVRASCWIPKSQVHWSPGTTSCGCLVRNGRGFLTDTRLASIRHDPQVARAGIWTKWANRDEQKCSVDSPRTTAVVVLPKLIETV